MTAHKQWRCDALAELAHDYPGFVKAEARISSSGSSSKSRPQRCAHLCDSCYKKFKELEGRAYMTAAVPSIDERRQPGLSETLGILIDPRMCRSCGATRELYRWRECDPNDKPTMVVVVLCKAVLEQADRQAPAGFTDLRRLSAPVRSELHFPHSRNTMAVGECGYSGRRQRLDSFAVRRVGISGFFRMWPAEPTDCAGKQDSLRPQLVEDGA